MKSKKMIALLLAFGFSAASFVGCGKSAVGIENATLNERGELVLEYTDGTEQNLGVVKGKDGQDGVDGQDGTNGQNGANGLNGKDGQDGESLDIEEVYAAAVANGYDGTFLGFLKEYLGTGESEDPEEYITQQLISSCVQIVSYHDYQTTTGFGPMASTEVTEGYSQGSGWFYSLNQENGDAYIVTNFHVIYDSDSMAGFAKRVGVYLYGSHWYNGETTDETLTVSDREIEAEVLGGSATYDVAVLRVSNSEIIKTASRLFAVEMDASPNVTVGQTVYAVGNANGQGTAVTKGVISLDSEQIDLATIDPTIINASTQSVRVLRTDAALNHGNSGGGVFNAQGKLIGMVNAGDDSGEVNAFGYAIPAYTIKNVVENLMENCDGGENLRMRRMLIGISTLATDSYSVYDEEIGLVRIEQQITVAMVSAGSLGEGKLQVGDILKTVTVGGQTLAVTRNYVVSEAMLSVDGGEEVTFTIERDGREMSVSIVFTDDYSVVA